MPAFPQVTREQIFKTQEEMDRRLNDAGIGKRALHMLRWSNMLDMGELESIREPYEQWKRSEVDILADCPACEANLEVTLLVQLKDDEEALKKAQPLLREKLSCAEVPEATFGVIMPSLIRLGKLKEAKKYHDIAYPRICDNRVYLLTMAGLLLYLGHVDDIETGLKHIERHTPWAVQESDRIALFKYLSATSAFLEKASRMQADIKLILPKEYSFKSATNEYNTKALADEFRREAQRVADQLDGRNQNPFYSNVIDEMRELVGC